MIYIFFYLNTFSLFFSDTRQAKIDGFSRSCASKLKKNKVKKDNFLCLFCGILYEKGYVIYKFYTVTKNYGCIIL